MKTIKTAEEILNTYFPLPKNTEAYEIKKDIIRAMEEYKAQFTGGPSDEAVKDGAKKHLKTIPALNYKSAYDFGTKQIEAFEAGAKFVRDNYLSDAVGFLEWIGKSNWTKTGDKWIDLTQMSYSVDRPEITTQELYNIFKTEKG